MDYHSVHGHDISSFDLPLPHRLPTVSAADALEQLMTDGSRRVPTGLDALDRALSGFTRHADARAPLPGGFSKGQVIEVWGPPASGKTTFGLQLAAGVLKHGRNVVWVDAFHPLCGTRLHQMTHAASASSASPAGGPEAERRDGMLHFTCPSLAHFIALLCRPTPSCVPPETSLIVVDSLSALVNQAFPRNQEPRNGPQGGPHRATQRLQMLQLIMTNLQKLAATRDVAIVILTQSATRMQAERGATLTPALNARAWDQGIATRLVLFRDWMFRDGAAVGFHFAGIQKLNGKTHQDGLGDVFPFRIQEDGLVGVDFDAGEPLLGSPRDNLAKRKLGSTDFEVADSEDDEDYGWDAEDADHMPIPPQWQGSEDLLVGLHDDEGNRIDDVSDGAGADSDEGGLTDE